MKKKFSLLRPSDPEEEQNRKSCKGLLLIIIILSTLLCHGCRNDTMVIFIPIEVKNLPKNFIIAGVHPKGIEVTAKGYESAIKNLASLDLQYKIDLSQANEGVISFQINKNLIELPSNVSIADVSPSFLSFRIEKRAIKTIPIQVITNGSPADNRVLKSATIKPTFVSIYGPADVIEKCEKIYTKPIDISGLTETAIKETALDPPESIFIENEGETYLVEISIDEKIIVKQFENIPLKIKNVSLPYKIDPSSVSIKIKGKAKEIEKITPDDIVAYLDVKKLKDGVYMQRAEIILPVGALLISAAPEIFTIMIGENKK